MDVFRITFQAVAALLGIGLLGFWIIGRKHLPANALGLLTSIAIDIAIPCLVLGNILTEFSPEKYPDWWKMPLWWIAFTVVAFGLTLITSLVSRKKTRSEFAMSLFFQNGIFFPLIIIAGLFKNPDAYLVSLFFFIFLQASMIYSTYPLFFRKTSTETKLSWQRIINPVLVSTVIGILIGLAGITSYIPNFVIMILTLVGAMAIPLFMLILGGNVYNDFVYCTTCELEGNKRFDTREVIKFVAIKSIIFPLVFLGLLIWIRPDYVVALIIILQAAVPPITAIPVFTERSGGHRAITSQFIVASFIFSIISIPAMIYLFSLFFPFPAQ